MGTVQYLFWGKKTPNSLTQRNMGASEWIYQLDAMSLGLAHFLHAGKVQLFVWS